jgi:nucleoporin SEH1
MFSSTTPSTTNNTSTSDTTSSRWVQKATLSDARRAVTTVEFAPRHLGLRLATGSADGVVRIYEALDTMNLNHWKLDGVIEAGVEDEFDAAGAAGGNETGGVEGRQMMTIGESSGNSGTTTATTTTTTATSSSNENMGVSSLSWCTGRFEPPTLCVGCSSGRASIYRYDDGARSWVEAIRLPNHVDGNGIPRGVLDVAWAPNVGRSYHLIATCGKDGRLKVHRVKRGRGGKGEGTAASSSSSLVYEGTEDLDQSEVWRCQWNLTGTVLASSGDCGVVKLWKSDFQGKFKCISEIVGDTTGMAATSAVRNQ